MAMSLVAPFSLPETEPGLFTSATEFHAFRIETKVVVEAVYAL
jgi:hypothetical protein